MTIQETLQERGSRYGDFTDHAKICDDLISTMERDVGPRNPWAELSPDKRQALRVIADKIARILSGDPEYRDSWWDIIGYATLVVERLRDAKE